MTLLNNPPANTDALANRIAFVTQATNEFILRATVDMQDAQTAGKFYVDVLPMVYTSFVQIQTYFQALGYTVTVPVPYTPASIPFFGFPPIIPNGGVQGPYGQTYTAWWPDYPHKFGFIPQLPVGFGIEWVNYCVANKLLGYPSNLIRIAWGS